MPVADMQEKDNIISQLLQQLATVNRLRDQEQVQFAAERQDLYACMDVSLNHPLPCNATLSSCTSASPSNSL